MSWMQALGVAFLALSMLGTGAGAYAVYTASEEGAPADTTQDKIRILVSSPNMKVNIRLFFPEHLKLTNSNNSFSAGGASDLPGKNMLMIMTLRGKPSSLARFALIFPEDSTLINEWEGPPQLVLRQGLTSMSHAELSQAVETRSSTGSSERVMIGRIKLSSAGVTMLIVGARLNNPLTSITGSRSTVGLPIISSFSESDFPSYFPEDSEADDSDYLFNDPSSLMRGHWYNASLTTYIRVGQVQSGRAIEFSNPSLQNPEDVAWTNPKVTPRYVIVDEAKRVRMSRYLFISGALAGVAGSLLIELIRSTLNLLGNPSRPGLKAP